MCGCEASPCNITDWSFYEPGSGGGAGAIGGAGRPDGGPLPDAGALGLSLAVWICFAAVSSRFGTSRSEKPARIAQMISKARSREGTSAFGVRRPRMVVMPFVAFPAPAAPAAGDSETAPAARA